MGPLGAVLADASAASASLSALLATGPLYAVLAHASAASASLPAVLALEPQGAVLANASAASAGLAARLATGPLRADSPLLFRGHSHSRTSSAEGTPPATRLLHLREHAPCIVVAYHSEEVGRFNPNVLEHLVH